MMRLPRTTCRHETTAARIRCLSGVLLAAFCATAIAQQAAPPAAVEEAAARIAEATARVQEDIAAATGELAALHDEVQKSRSDSGRELSALRREIAALREKLRQTQTAAERDAERAAATETEALHLGSVIEFTEALSTEYRRAFETRLSGAEGEYYRSDIEALDAALGNTGSIERLEGTARALDLSGRHLQSAAVGHVFAGPALDATGNVVQGEFRRFGPMTYFDATGGTLSGVVIQRLNSVTPSVLADLPLPIRRTDAGERLVPVDVTDGAALKTLQTEESLPEHLRKGGIVIVPLLLLAAVCSVLAVYKVVSLLAVSQRGSEKHITAILDALAGDRADEALELAHGLRRPLGPVICVGIEHRNAPKEHIEEIMYERILSQVPALERLLSPLAVCASAAPLLGLLGTVTGMIHTFRLITVFGTGDAKLLSSGISEALITTEVGLMIAIPALLVHAYLSRRVRKAIAVTQQSAVMFVNGLKLTGQADP